MPAMSEAEMDAIVQRILPRLDNEPDLYERLSPEERHAMGQWYARKGKSNASTTSTSTASTASGWTDTSKLPADMFDVGSDYLARKYHETQDMWKAESQPLNAGPSNRAQTAPSLQSLDVGESAASPRFRTSANRHPVHTHLDRNFGQGQGSQGGFNLMRRPDCFSEQEWASLSAELDQLMAKEKHHLEALRGVQSAMRRRFFEVMVRQHAAPAAEADALPHGSEHLFNQVDRTLSDYGLELPVRTAERRSYHEAADLEGFLQTNFLEILRWPPHKSCHGGPGLLLQECQAATGTGTGSLPTIPLRALEHSASDRGGASPPSAGTGTLPPRPRAISPSPPSPQRSSGLHTIVFCRNIQGRANGHGSLATVATKCQLNVGQHCATRCGLTRDDDNDEPLPRHDEALHSSAKRQPMYKTRSSIDEWLSQGDNPTPTPAPTPTPTLSRKRRRDDSEPDAGEKQNHSDMDMDLPSPPITEGQGQRQQQSAAPCTTPVRPGKRTRMEADGHGHGHGRGTADDGADDDDPTPRRRQDVPDWDVAVAASVGSHSSTQTSESTSTSTNSQTSSVKRRRRLDVGAPLLAAFFDNSRKPPPLLDDLATQLQDLGDDKHFVWPELHAEITRPPFKDSPMFRSLAKPVWYPQLGQPSPSLGPSPSCAQLQKLVDKARECQTEGASESHWNSFIHSHVLELALESHPRLRAVNCASATIDPEYLALQGTPMSSTKADAKKVDFCIAIHQPQLERHPAITDIKHSDGSVNHTSSPHLTCNPIAISIETKAASPNQEEAELQMGVWMTAHFARLRALLDRQCNHHRSQRGNRPQRSNRSQGSDRVPNTDAMWRQAMGELGFLPGLLILQHHWHFIAATWAPPRPSGNNGGPVVTLWRSVPIGSTNTPEGICQIIHVVRRLAEWAETVYWPWFRRWALGDSPPPTFPVPALDAISLCSR
ncbi:hypothetical protein QBC39DRAFT_334089 [Podospora conica]|nr:hypothetical protein QBC39DRAFT_334089 [Schizothecium conicum]